ncbi:MAG: hypothetical protein H6741_19740 [Alphaproteobacteria bacterium]|nr:hypothetical protein [Alphaproteobacteria bacterium]MCB9794938.1 hypothetical protein [Alphaproteobacteria bacterium]
MKGDFSRLSFDQPAPWDAVAVQQGRVQLDSDWNTQAQLAAERSRTLASDVIGVNGGPRGAAGFQLGLDGDGLPALVQGGSYYVDGLLLTAPAEVTCLDDQPHLSQSLPSAPGVYVGVLVGWRALVTALDDAQILEPAMGGQETSLRVKNAWALRLLPLAADDPGDASSWGDGLRTVALAREAAAALYGDTSLKATFQLPASAVRGNQLIRVEVHRPEVPSFKWDDDNASVQARVQVESYELQHDTDGAAIAGQLLLDTGARPLDTLFRVGDLVELLTESVDPIEAEEAPRERRGVLLRVTGVQDSTLYFDPSGFEGEAAPDALQDGARARRWRGHGVMAEAPVELTEGLTVAFSEASTATTGQYWTFPLRTQGELPEAAPGTPSAPQGPVYFVAPIGLLWLNGATWETLEARIPASLGGGDLRELFSPLTNLEGVDRAGDTMTGALHVEDDLSTSGAFTAGGDIRAGGKLTVGSMSAGGGITSSGNMVYIDQPLRIEDALSLGNDSHRITTNKNSGSIGLNASNLVSIWIRNRTKVASFSEAEVTLDAPLAVSGETMTQSLRVTGGVEDSGVIQITRAKSDTADDRAIDLGRTDGYRALQFHGQGYSTGLQNDTVFTRSQRYVSFYIGGDTWSPTALDAGPDSGAVCAGYFHAGGLSVRGELQSGSVSVSGGVSVAGNTSMAAVTLSGFDIVPAYVRGTSMAERNLSGDSIQAVIQVGGTTHVSTTSRGLTIVVLNRTDLSVHWIKRFDTWASTNNSNWLKDELYNLNKHHLVFVVSADAFGLNLNSSAIGALQNCGATQSTITTLRGAGGHGRDPYALIGMADYGSIGLEAYSAFPDSADAEPPTLQSTLRYAEISTLLIRDPMSGLYAPMNYTHTR